MKTNKKAIFLDLDGTLLTDDKKVTQENRSAINRMLNGGHSVVIATGRPLTSAVLEAEKLGLTGDGCYLIAYNGGILYDTAHQKIVFKRTVPLRLVYEVFDEANRRGVYIHTYDDTHVLVEPRCDNDIVRYYTGRIGMTHLVTPSVRTISSEPVKMLMIDRQDPEPLQEMRDWIAANFGDELDSYFSSNEFVEIVAKGLNKGNALRQMAQILDIPVENTIAAGDAANDITMLEAAHIGCAMANAAAEVIAAADYVTEHDNNHSGIAEIINRFV